MPQLGRASFERQRADLGRCPAADESSQSARRWSRAPERQPAVWLRERQLQRLYHAACVGTPAGALPEALPGRAPAEHHRQRLARGGVHRPKLSRGGCRFRSSPSHALPSFAAAPSRDAGPTM